MCIRSLLQAFFFNNIELNISGRHWESDPGASGPGFDFRWQPNIFNPELFKISL